MQKWYDWLGEMKKKDERKKIGIIAPAKVKSDDQECGRQCWSSCTRSRSPQHGEEERRSRRKKKSMSGCWTDVKQRGKNGHSIGNVTRTWRTSIEK